MSKLLTCLAMVVVFAGLSFAAFAQDEPPPDLPMQYIPPGEVTLDDGDPVAVGEFFIGIRPVTAAVYALCVADGACSSAASSGDGLMVQQQQAEAFCAWAGLRLPTRAEWLRAAPSEASEWTAGSALVDVEKAPFRCAYACTACAATAEPTATASPTLTPTLAASPTPAATPAPVTPAPAESSGDVRGADLVQPVEGDNAAYADMVAVRLVLARSGASFDVMPAGGLLPSEEEADGEALIFYLEMGQPIAESRAEAEQVWYLMLDLDGRPSTGLSVEAIKDPMYTGLGADFIVPLNLQDNGSVAGIGFFPEAPDTETISVDVSLSQNRSMMTISIPLESFSVQAESAGFSELEAMRWRVAAIVYGKDEDMKDIYPELDTTYPAAEEEPAATPEPPTEEAPAPALAQGGACRAVTNANVNLRAGPGTNFARLGTVEAGTEIRITGVNLEGDWYVARAEGGGTAWVAGFLLSYFRCPEGVEIPTVEYASTPEGAASAAEEEPAEGLHEEGCWATTNADINLRAGPGTGYDKVGEIDYGTELEVTGTNTTTDWYYVQIEDFGKAWIAGFLLENFWCPGVSELPVVEP